MTTRTMNSGRKTARGVARMLVRGIRATWDDEHQNAELLRLAEAVQDMAMARDADRDGLARGDCEWLDELAMWLDEESDC